MSRIHAQKPHMAEDQYSPCYVNLVLCIHSSFSELQSYWIWVQNTLNCFWWCVCTCYEVCYMTVLTGSSLFLNFSLCVICMCVYVWFCIYSLRLCVSVLLYVSQCLWLYVRFSLWAYTFMYMCVKVITTIYPKLINKIKLKLS